MTEQTTFPIVQQSGGLKNKFSADKLFVQTEELVVKNYQVYPQRFFDLNSNDLRWVLLDYKTGIGKTIISLLMAKGQNANCIVIGNEANQSAFQEEIEKFPDKFNEERFQYITRESLREIDNEQVTDFCAGNILIVDEFEKLYSETALNQYGEELQYICSKILGKIKIIALSGTPLNTRWEELCFLLNIFRGTDYYDPETAKQEDLLKEINGHVISYQVIADTSVYPDVIYMVADAKNGKTSQPKEVKKDLVDFKTFPRIECPMTSEEWEKDKHEEQQFEEGVFEKQAQMQIRLWYDPKLPKQPTSKHIFKDDDVALDNLKRCAPNPYFFVKSILDRFKDKIQGKICAYNDLIESQCGLTFYENCLKENGFIRTGEKTEGTTVCIYCGIQQQYHDENNKHSKSTHNYTPAQFMTFKAELKEAERNEMRKLFNSHQNRNGDVCILLFLSKIAETGLSLYGVNYYYILEYIPGLSLYEQIVARAVRFASHDQIADAVPPRHFVKVYNLTEMGPNGESSNISDYEDVMFENGKEVDVLMEKIRAKEKFSDSVISDKMHDSDDVEFLQEFLKNATFMKTITYSDMYKLLSNQHLSQTPFQIENLSKENVLQAAHTYYDLVTEDGKEIFYRKYSEKFLNELDDPRVMEQVTIKGLEIKQQNMLDTLIDEREVYPNILKHYMKIYAKFLAADWEKYVFGFNTIFSAYFIFEGYVYMEDDETKFLENHKKFWDIIHKMNLRDVYDKEKAIVKKFKIKGIYFKNRYHLPGFTRIVFTNSYIENMTIFTLTENFPTYKYNKRDFYITMREYLVGCDFDEMEFNKLNNIFRIRWNLEYFYEHDMIQPLRFK